MDLQKKQDLIFKLLLVFLVVGIVLMIGIFWFVKTGGSKCLADPLIYYQAKANVTCFCNDQFGLFK